MRELTRLLQAWSDGDGSARDAPAEGEPRPYLFSADLANETYLRVARQSVRWQNRDQFFAWPRDSCGGSGSTTQGRKALKRGRALGVTLVEGRVALPPEPVDLVELDEALAELAVRDERQAQLVELRFFGGLSHDESTLAMGISTSTAKREWAMAKAWLYGRISESMRRHSDRA